MAKKATRPTHDNWDKVQFSDSDWLSFDLSGSYRTITEVLPELSDLNHWKTHMESKGFETKCKVFDSESTKGYALLARARMEDR